MADLTLPAEGKHVMFRYGGAVLAVAAATGLRWLLQDLFGSGVTFITYFPAIALVAILAGGGPAVLSTILSTVAAATYLRFGMSGVGELVATGLFAISGFIISTTAEMLHRAWRREATTLEGQVVERTRHLEQANTRLKTEVEDRRRTEETLRETEDRLRFALETIHTGAWELDLEDHTAVRSLQHDRVFGYAELLPKWTYEMFLEHVLPEDRTEVNAKFRQSTATQSDWSFECRIRRADGAVRWIWAAGRPRADAAGRVRRVAGIVQDITERKQTEQALLTSEERLRAILHAVTDAIITIDQHGFIQVVNPAVERLFGYAAAEMIGQNLKMLMPSPYREEHDRYLARYRQTGEKRIIGIGREVEARRKDGSTFPIDLAVSEFHLGDQPFFTGIVRDINERKRADEALRQEIGQRQEVEAELRKANEMLEDRVAERTAALRESEERFRSAFESAPTGMWLMALDGRWLKVNCAFCEMLGRTEAELLAATFQALTHPDDLDADLAIRRRLLAGEIAYFHREKRYLHKLGQTISVILSLALVRNARGEPLYLLGQVVDITQRKEAEKKVQKSLEEKEILLKEIHHRVKNNLQVISSLLFLQSQYTHDARTIEMFRESQHRVQSMALVHERLYRSHDLAQVDFTDYLENLVNYLFQSYQVDTNRIHLQVDVEEVRLPIDAAVPCGLVLSELISNCLKHAFRGRDRGRIRVELLAHPPAEVSLVVSDDGVGLPPAVDLQTCGTLGMQLIATLVDQLHGRVEVIREAGTTIQIHFPVPKPIPPHGALTDGHSEHNS